MLHCRRYFIPEDTISADWRYRFHCWIRNSLFHLQKIKINKILRGVAANSNKTVKSIEPFFVFLQNVADSQIWMSEARNDFVSFSRPMPFSSPFKHQFLCSRFRVKGQQTHIHTFLQTFTFVILIRLYVREVQFQSPQVHLKLGIL